MSNGNNKEILLMVHNAQGAWTILEDPESKNPDHQYKPFRSEASAQREGGLLLRDKKIDSYKIFKMLSEHH